MTPLSHDAPAPAAPSLSVGLLLAMQAAMQPRKPFLVGERGWTFQETDAAAAHVGWMLRQLGVAPGDGVIVMTPTGDRAAIALAGVMRAGCQPILAPPNLPFADGFALTTTLRPTAIIGGNSAGGATMQAAARLAAASASVSFVLGFGDDLPRGVTDLGPRMERARAATDAARAEDAPEVTSLTIACPGGNIEQAALAPLLTACVSLAGAALLRSGDRIISPLPFTDPVALTTGLFAGLFAGAELALLDAPDSQALSKALDTKRPRHLVWPDTLTDLALEVIGDGVPLRSLIRRRRDIDQPCALPPGLRAEQAVDVAARDNGELQVEAMVAPAADIAPQDRQIRAAS